MTVSHAQARQIAARYARAFFDIAVDAKQESAVAANFQALKGLMETSEELRKAIKNPMISAAEKQGVFTELLAKLEGVSTTGDFIAFLAQKQRLEILPALAELFSAKLAAHNGELSAEVVTAKKLKVAQRKAIKKALKDAAGKPVSVSEKVDEALLGGIQIRLGSKLLDHSVAGKLSRLAVALKQPTMAS